MLQYFSQIAPRVCTLVLFITSAAQYHGWRTVGRRNASEMPRIFIVMFHNNKNNNLSEAPSLFNGPNFHYLRMFFSCHASFCKCSKYFSVYLNIRPM